VDAFNGHEIQSIEKTLKHILKEQQNFLVKFNRKLKIDELVSILDASLSQFRKILDLMYDKYINEIVRIKKKGAYSGSNGDRLMNKSQLVVEIHLRRVQSSCEILEQLAREKTAQYEQFVQRFSPNASGNQVEMAYLKDWEVGLRMPLRQVSLFVNKTVAGIDDVLDTVESIVHEEAADVSSNTTLDERIANIDQKVTSIKAFGDNFMRHAALARAYLAGVASKVDNDISAKREFLYHYDARKCNVLSQLRQLYDSLAKVVAGSGTRRSITRLQYFIKSWENTTKLDLLKSLEDIREKFVAVIDRSDFATRKTFSQGLRSAWDFVTDTNITTLALENSHGPSGRDVVNKLRGVLTDLKKRTDELDEARKVTVDTWETVTSDFSVIRRKLRTFNQSLNIDINFIR
jgi:hypothetical protein